MLRDSTQPLRVGYILKMFPRLSETFILNELLELQRQGTELSIFSLLYPADGRFHASLGQLDTTVEYVPREKVETYWEKLQAGDRSLIPSTDRWEQCLDFLHRWGIPKDLDLLFRSMHIAVMAKQRGIQHFHAHFATIATRVAALVHILTGIPFSFTAHAKDIYRETVDRGLYAELLEMASFNITVSDSSRQFVLDHTPNASTDKVLRLYNGIDLSYFHSDRPIQRHDVPHIVSVGRLVPKKGFDVLLQALSEWKKSGANFRTTIIGNGEQEVELKSLCEDLGLSDQVRFAGALSQDAVKALINDASIVALACVPDQQGNQDALPTVLLEALALDKPIVSTRIAGVPEIVGEQAGLVVEPQDAGGFHRALASVWADVQNGGYAKREGRKRAELLFDLRKNAGRLRELYLRSACLEATA